MEGKMLMMFRIMILMTCFWWNSMSSPNSPRFLSLLKNVVDERADANGLDTPNIRISGPNGYCMDVKDGSYRDDNPIIIWPCSSNPRINQLWKFESDGTLRSNGMCLTTNGYDRGSLIRIFNCSIVPQDTAIWQAADNGVITNLESGLALTAISGKSGTQLTLETNIFSSFQTWQVNNDTQPSLVYITGLNGLCLQPVANAVWVAECENNYVGQRWRIYPDRTIRPDQSPDGCLSYNDLIDDRVVVLSCGLGSSSQRWMFIQDSGVILNERVNLVMDVEKSDPSRKRIIVWVANGKPNQYWQINPLSY